MIEKFLNNKKAIVVGPASYLQNSNKKSFIESFDVIIRLNDGYNINKEYYNDIGTRTDILYHCLWGPLFPPSIPLLRSKVSIVKTSYPYIPPFDADIKRFTDLNQDRIPFEIYDLKKYSTLSGLLESRPNTGTSAIYDILSYNVKSLHISGITMYAGGHLKNYRKNYIFETRQEVEEFDKVHKNHNIKNQIELLKNIFNDDRVTLDKEVREAICE